MYEYLKNQETHGHINVTFQCEMDTYGVPVVLGLVSVAITIFFSNKKNTQPHFRTLLRRNAHLHSEGSSLSPTDFVRRKAIKELRVDKNGVFMITIRKLSFGEGKINS